MKWWNRLFEAKSPFPEMEEVNRKMKTMFEIVDTHEDVLDKILSGISHILGEDWFKFAEVSTTPMQQSLISNLIIIVLHKSLRQEEEST